MKKLLNKFALVALGMFVGVPAAWAGPVVIDGTDANDHGFSNGTTNEEGWLYMQKVLENLAPQVGNGNTTIVSLGTELNGFAYDAINSAFSLSNIASTWNLVNITGATDIANFLDGSSVGGTSLANTGILYLPTANNSSGDLDDTELAVINARGAAINNFVGGAGNPNLGGGLFAMAESSNTVPAYGWLSSVIPGFTAVDVGTGGISSDILLTPEGQAAFPGLTNADLSAGPWHNYFTGNIGGLKVLATAVDDNGVVRPQIVGGGAGTVINPPPTGVPEPASVVGILAVGAFGVGSHLKRKQQKKAGY